jgi:hypothetical protein
MNKTEQGIRFAQSVVNYAFFVVGMISVWNMTHNWMVMGAAFVASLHFNILDYVRKQNSSTESKA